MVVHDVRAKLPNNPCSDQPVLDIHRDWVVDELTRGERKSGSEARPGVALTRGYQSDFVPSVDEPLDQREANPLDATVARWRDFVERRRDDSHPQWA